LKHSIHQIEMLFAKDGVGFCGCFVLMCWGWSGDLTHANSPSSAWATAPGPKAVLRSPTDLTLTCQFSFPRGHLLNVYKWTILSRIFTFCRSSYGARCPLSYNYTMYLTITE
jgi:hypothetical protein